MVWSIEYNGNFIENYFGISSLVFRYWLDFSLLYKIVVIVLRNLFMGNMIICIIYE